MKTRRWLDTDSRVETRETPDGKRYIDGLIPYGSRSEDLGGFIEQIDPAAFRKTIADGAEVFAFWAHNEAEVLGSRTAGTLKLENRAEGLFFSVEMRDNAISEDRWQAVQRGDVAGVSFGFITEREEWDNAQKPALRTLKEVRLLELSPGVSFPAYKGAQSAAALRTVVSEARSMNKTAETPPAEIPAPPVPAPEDTKRAEAEALRYQQTAILELIKAREGIK